jgi:uncharacterized membrane protein
MPGLLELYVLRVVHVVVGVCWVGAIVFLAAFLIPSVRAAGPAGGAIMRELMLVRKLSQWLVGAMLLTLLSGIGLYWHDSAGFQSGWLGSGPGRTFGLGGVIAIVASVIGATVNSPTARRLGELAGRLGAGAPPTPEELATMAALQARLALASKVVAALLLVAALLMAVARYVP